jgi:uncharacterized protein (DUF1330 family)
MMFAALMLAATQPASAPLPPSSAAPPSESTCDQPVIMVVAGPTHDRARMMAYARAIADSQLYQRLGGYYLNLPRAVATFEGDPPAGYTVLMVRFPCLANAEAFWMSRVYQEEIKPLRLGPSAGDYIVTVYPEAPLREDMAGAVGDNGYRRDFSAEGIEQVGGTP